VEDGFPRPSDSYEVVAIPACVEIMGERCFNDRQDSRRTGKAIFIETGSKLREIEAFAFTGRCTYPLHITIPQSVIRIGKGAFSESQLHTATFEEGSKLQKIESHAFADCKFLRMQIPKSVVSLGPNAFRISWDSDKAYKGSRPIVTLEQGSNLHELGNGAFSNNAITTITVPKGVEIITHECFSFCVGFNEVLFEEGTLVHTFEDSAFRSVSLRSIVVPK
jgi:hypothetical protein